MSHPRSSVATFARVLLAGAISLGAALSPNAAAAAEPVSCLSTDPSVWPAPSRPYFMLAIDTSGSMLSLLPAGNVNSCGYLPESRVSHTRCAVKNTVQAFGGEVNFGLSTFAVIQSGCSGACFGNCGYFCFQQELNTTGGCFGCGPKPNAFDATTRAGAFIRVPMLQDVLPPGVPLATNVPSLVGWADNDCSTSTEIFGAGNTPLNGMLRDMQRYFAGTWTAPDGSVSYSTPLVAADLAGTGINGSTGCRSVNVILLTDGDETCDTQQDAVNAASTLYGTGVTVGGKTFKIRTHVINFIGGNINNTDAIAAAGGTGASYQAQNEIQLAQALANILAGAIKPEVCDNGDNNCNGCTDEGYTHYCDQGQTCCAWQTDVQRLACLTSYTQSINAGNPSGNLALLPCTTTSNQTDPLHWLCYDPKEACDNVDNNCSGGVDEGVVKCGNPAHCPIAETCNALDDDCDGLTDENVCPGGCVPAPEVCDGCDNDCDGTVDEGAPSAACGLSVPPNCIGTLACKPAQQAPFPGGCVAGGGFGNCSNAPSAELCDGFDNDCDGVIDDGVGSTPCVPAGTPGNLVYGGTSQCKQGTMPCGSAVCSGFVGPSSEVCDGLDNDCDGLVDDTPFGINLPCGLNQPPCSPGLTACVNGALVCTGGISPQPEVCDGVDNDCDASIDEAPLSDAPAVNGCWNGAGNCCTFGNLSWCPPTGAGCFDNGNLAAPCNKGTLVCSAGAWSCLGISGPQAEACDGVDNDCDGAIDEVPIPQVGLPCGSNVGECQEGALACTAGVLDCVGDVPPTPELCDALDNDCDGATDDGISVGGSCTPPYDAVLYPGPRDNLPCQPGVLACDGMGGSVCAGGVGPSPELCDGLDNDCDGSVDEPGSAPDGIDGSANPFPPPAGNVGDACGVDTGACVAGVLACKNGLFVCEGGQGAAAEECDCSDNDCDGVTDNTSPSGPPLCGAGKDCVSSSGQCQCAAPCAEVCPGGQTCQEAYSSETGEYLGFYCVSDPNAGCGDCTVKTVTDAQGKILCAPAGTILDGCITPPVCTCKGQSGCQPPCFGVTCDAGSTCLSFGPTAGQCGQDDCTISPCPGCGTVCFGSQCIDGPCTAGVCAVDEVCKPSADFTTFECVGSCANVECPTGTECKEGQCAPTCDPPCAPGTYCDEAASPPVCVNDLCAAVSCTGTTCCDHASGLCGNCPCDGVLCPSEQVCKDGECVGDTGAGGAGGGPSSSSSATTGTGAGPVPEERHIWGLATGGGGCSCRVQGDATNGDGALAFCVALAGIGVARRRRTAAARQDRGAR